MRAFMLLAVVLLASTAHAQGGPLVRLRSVDPIVVAAGDDSGPQAFTLADVNKDGKPDLVVIDREDDQVAVSIGRGDGTFEASRVYELDGTPTAVAVADLSSPFGSDQAGDIDGNPDLVIAYEDGFADVWLGRGDGEFDLPEQDLIDVLDSAELIGIVVGDFDGNGRNDLALLDFFDEVYLLCNARAISPPATPTSSIRWGRAPWRSPQATSTTTPSSTSPSCIATRATCRPSSATATARSTRWRGRSRPPRPRRRRAPWPPAGSIPMRPTISSWHTIRRSTTSHCSACTAARTAPSPAGDSRPRSGRPASRSPTSTPTTGWTP
jgi:hypothetical protein